MGTASNITYKKTKTKLRKGKSTIAKRHKWILRLYLAGQTPKAITAFNNLKSICEEQLKGRYHIEVIDILKNPQLARDHQIFAVPTLVRKLPGPARSIIGDLSNTERVLVGLDLIGRDLSKQNRQSRVVIKKHHSRRK